MRFGLWGVAIRGPTVTMGVLEGYDVLRRRILRILLILVVLMNPSHIGEPGRFDIFIGSSPYPMREDTCIFFRLSVFLPYRNGKNGPSGPVQGPVSLFWDLHDRPDSGVFARSLTENRASGPVCVSGNITRKKTGLFRTCFF